MAAALDDANAGLSRALMRLAGVRGRAAGTDAERRGALALAEELGARGRAVRVDTHWVHPRWALAGALHALAGLVASVLSVGAPVAAAIVTGVALLSALDDALGPLRLVRRLLGARATQNVVSPAPDPRPVTLVLTAALDSPRPSALDRGDALLRRLLRRWPSPPAGLAGALALVLAACVARALDVDERWLGVLQVLPSTVLILLIAGFVDAALAPPSDAPRDAAGAALAVAVARALDERPPRRLGVEVVLAGAGHAGGALGARAWVRERRRQGVDATEVAVLHLGPAGDGPPRWLAREGVILLRPAHPQLGRLLGAVAAAHPALGAEPATGWGPSGAVEARRARWPAVTVRSAGDGRSVDPASLRAVAELVVRLVGALDRDLRTTTAPPSGQD